jgi:hypothetical protein
MKRSVPWNRRKSRCSARSLLSHLIVFVVFFQAGVLFATQQIRKCEGCHRQSVQEKSPSGIARHRQDRSSASFDQESTQQQLSQFSVSRVGKDDLLSFLGFRPPHPPPPQQVEEESSAETHRHGQEALVIHLQSKKHVSSAKTASLVVKQESPMEALAACPSIKVLYRKVDDLEDRCLAIASFEESYHVYQWQKDETGQYRPVASSRMPTARTTNPLEAFHWVRILLSLHDQIDADLRNVLSPPSADRAILLLVVDKTTLPILQRMACSLLQKGRRSILVWSLDLETHKAAQLAQVPSFFHPDLNARLALSERGPLLSEVLAVQHLILLGYHVIVAQAKDMLPHLRDSMERLEREGQMQKSDILATVPSRRIFQNSTLYIVRSTVRTKFMWSKLVLYADLILRDGGDLVDDLVWEYISLFGIRTHWTNWTAAETSDGSRDADLCT